MCNNKLRIIVILILLISFSATYCVFTKNVEKTGSIQVEDLSNTLLNNSEFLSKVQNLDSSIISINKITDLNRVATLPTVELNDSNIVSTSNSNVPTYLWIENGNIYYYTIAEVIDINDN